jgi:isochorismate synthase
MIIDWQAVENRLAALAAAARPARLLSVGIALPRWPDAQPPVTGDRYDWCFWQRPEQELRLLGAGRAFGATSAGSGRFAALHAALRGLQEGWRYSPEGVLPRAFTGFAFEPDGGAPLPAASLWVPALLLQEQDGRPTLTLSCATDRTAGALPRWQALWQAMTTDRAVPPAPTFFATPANPLADQAFLARGRAALAAIAAGAADKLVLTRTLRLQAVCHPAAVLTELAAHHPACAVFAAAQDGRTFLGASPEVLLAVRGERVAVDALAGTAWQTETLDTDKNRREHDFVARAIGAALGELCDDIVVPDAPEVMRLETLTHLRRRVAARRPPDVGVFDLVACLHPSPAVGGAPTAAALDWLASHGDRRGAWYTGGIGWIDAAGDCDIAVALRCGLLEGSTATLYAGAGFVAGSDPAQELAETEAKLAAMRDALVAAGHHTRRRAA